MDMGKKLELTIEEGQTLLSISANFSLPEKLGSDNTYSVADRAIAGDEVRKLYRELRSRSPLLQTPERWQRFGPTDAWTEIKGESGRIGHKLTKPWDVVSISIDDDLISGIIWCLLVALHPASASVNSISVQVELLWPMAAKINKSRIIRQTIGMDDPKVLPKRWKSDDEFDGDKAVKKEDEKG